MASVANIVRFLPASGSTGDFVYSSGVTGYRTPTSSPALTDGATYRYRAESSDLSEWEIGEGTWTTATTTLARTTIIHSSTGAKVSFTTAPNVAIVVLADQFVNPAGDTMTGSLVVPNASGLKIKDTDASHTLGIVGGSNLTADRTLTLTTGDANRTLTLTADSSVGGTAYVSGGTDVAVADGGTGASTAADAATNLGLGTGDSPQFTGVNIGHATDTTITRVSAGNIAVEGNAIYRAGGTDVAVADGGTGASTLTANNVILGNGTSAVQFVAPGTSGNVLTSNGTTWNSTAPAASGGKAADQQSFASSGTWTKPSGFGAKAMALIQNWGAGAGAGRGPGSAQFGGGGGGYTERWILLSSLGATETVTIGAGGAGRTGSSGAGTDGGSTTFGSWLTAYGGRSSYATSGVVGAGGQPTGKTMVTYAPALTTTSANGTAYDGFAVIPHPWSGGHGKTSTTTMDGWADAFYGGGGGGCGGASASSGGTSVVGGAGGAGHATAPSAGTAPGGGGGGGGANVNGANGAAGQCIVTVFDGA